MNGRERLREWLDRSRTSQRKLAVMIGMHFTHLSQILSGRRSPGLVNAINIERVTGIAVESWMPTSVDKTRKPVSASVGKRRIGKA